MTYYLKVPHVEPNGNVLDDHVDYTSNPHVVVFSVIPIPTLTYKFTV